jgi:hypothetical protein
MPPIAASIAAVGIVGIARQTAPGLHRFGAAGEDRHAVPAFLPVPDRAVAGDAQRARRKFVIRRLQLLETHDIWRGLFHPPEQVGKPPVDAVDVVGRDPHRIVQMPDMQEARRPAGQVQRRVTMTVWNTSIRLLLSAGGRRPTEIQKEGGHE